VPKLVARATFDNVLKMISEMNKEKFEEDWALPSLELLCKSVKGIDPARNCVGFGSAMFGRKAFLMVNPQFRAGGNLIVHFLSDQESKTLQGQRPAHHTRMEHSPQSNIRMALYRIYNIFDQIHARLKNEKLSDQEVLQKLRSGKLLGSDPRFEAVRNPPGDNKGTVKPIPLNEKDGRWLIDTHLAKFLTVESELLPALRDQVKRRVAERKKGLIEIFS